MKKVKINSIQSCLIDSFEASDGRIFYNESDCLAHEELYEKLFEKYNKIKTINGWYYITSEKEYNDLCNYIRIEHRETCNFHCSDHIGWIQFDCKCYNDCPDVYFGINAKEYLEELKALRLIK